MAIATNLKTLSQLNKTEMIALLVEMGYPRPLASIKRSALERNVKAFVSDKIKEGFTSDRFARIFPRGTEDEEHDEVMPSGGEDEDDRPPSDDGDEPSASQHLHHSTRASPHLDHPHSIGPLAPSQRRLLQQQLAPSRRTEAVSMRRALKRKIAGRLSARPEHRRPTPTLEQLSGNNALQGEFMFVKSHRPCVASCSMLYHPLWWSPTPFTALCHTFGSTSVLNVLHF
jgi:hypothetical protein